MPTKYIAFQAFLRRVIMGKYFFAWILGVPAFV